jgi:5-methyltetrahydrofolate--homocysteine methyltransferase
MAIRGLTIIGESINDSIPSTKKLFDANDFDGIQALAKSQEEKGAAYIDVNVGSRSPSFMAEMVRRLQAVTAKPLSIDTPDLELARAGLAAYDARSAGGRMPILNSISPLRLEMLELCEHQKFMPILMLSERVEDGISKPNRTGEESYQTARQMLRAMRQSRYGLSNDQLIFDFGIAPIGADSEGNLGRLLDGMKRIHEDPDFAGVHMSVGLSNFTVMLPPKRADGSPVRSPLESAFLTLAMPLGLDMIIGSMARKYEILAADHPAMQCLARVLQSPGFDAILCVREFYS